MKNSNADYILLLSSVGPIESIMYLSSSFVMCLSSIGDSAICVNQTIHHIKATKPTNRHIQINTCRSLQIP